MRLSPPYDTRGTREDILLFPLAGILHAQSSCVLSRTSEEHSRYMNVVKKNLEHSLRGHGLVSEVVVNEEAEIIGVSSYYR